MKAWYRASELSGLPGMPSTRRGVLKRAATESWTSRDAVGRGGSWREYSIECLPEITRTFLQTQTTQLVVEVSEAAKAGALNAARTQLRESLQTTSEHNRRAESLREAISLAPTAQARLDAKLEALRLLEIYRQAHSYSITEAEHRFADAYNAGLIAIDQDLAQRLPKISAPSLQRWRLQVKAQGIAALAGGYGNRKGTSKIDLQDDVREFVLGIVVKTPHARATHVLQALRARYRGVDGAQIPSLRSLERWLTRWKSEHRQTFTALTNPDEWKNRYMAAFGSASEGIARLNQLWEMDSTPADVMLTDGRHSIIGVIDVYSRRTKLLVTKTSKATAIATLVRSALLEWGAPEEIKTDNGSDYTAKHLTRVFLGLDIRQELCPPFQPWRKPHIERFFGTFCRDLVELLDGFIGHSVADREAIRARKSFADRLMKRGEVIDITMSAAEFQYFCDRWCEDIYAHRPHEGLADATPFELVANWRQPVRRVDDERALDLLLAEAPGNNGIRTVQKRGVQLPEGWFVAPELEAHIGTPVQVRYLPDAGRIVVYGGAELQFICIAVNPELAGIDRKELAAKARQIQQRRVQDERAALRSAARKVKAEDIVGEILRDQAIAAGKLAMFPRRADAHDTPALRNAADAVAALDAPRRTTAELTASEEFAAARAALDAERAKPVAPVFETPFARAYWIAEQGLTRTLTEEERDYLTRFREENPRSAKSLDDLLAQRHGAKREQDASA